MLEVGSARITRIELTLGLILKQPESIDKCLDAMFSNNTAADDAVSNLRGIFPITTKAGFEDVEAKLKNDGDFRNKYVSNYTFRQTSDL